MPTGFDSVRVRLRVSPSTLTGQERRLLVPLAIGSVGRTLVLLMVPDLNTPRSIITPSALRELRSKGLVTEELSETA